MAQIPLSTEQDSRLFEVEVEDPAVRVDIEGGYEVTRPRHTRTPRRTYRSGWTHLTDANRATLETFWDTHKGGSVIFDWWHPVKALWIAVRFTKAISFKYVGEGLNFRWDATFEVREA